MRKLSINVYWDYLIPECTRKQLSLSTAESCTGGMIAEEITSIAGASAVFTEAIVSYSNESKIKRLGVSPVTLEQHGAVSEETVREMLNGLSSDCRIAVSGIAGPGGGTTEKPLGTVYIGVQVREKQHIRKYRFTGTRNNIRHQAATTAAEMLHALVSKETQKTQRRRKQDERVCQ